MNVLCKIPLIPKKERAYQVKFHGQSNQNSLIIQK